MKITSVTSSVLSVPFTAESSNLTFAGRPWAAVEILLVRVETADGLTGWGEAFGHAAIPATKAALDSVVAPLFVGRETKDIPALMKEIAHVVHLLGRNGPHVFALSGIDIALWDIAAKRAGKPLYKLLGGSEAVDHPGYASLIRYGDLPTVAKATAAAAAAGYRYVKLHEVTREAVLAAKAAAPGVEIMLDTNCPWSSDEAIGMAKAMKSDGLFWLEEPVWPPEDYDSLAKVRAEGIPVTAGENAQGYQDFRRMFDVGAVDIAQPSVTKVGGITEMMRIIELADSKGVRVVPHSPYYGPGFVATLHIATAMKTKPLIEAMWMTMADNPFDPWVRPRNGKFRAPDKPGLGCEPDPAILARCSNEKRVA